MGEQPRKPCSFRRVVFGGHRVADRGVVPLMAAKATSMPEGRPRPEDDPSEEARNRTPAAFNVFARDLPLGAWITASEKMTCSPEVGNYLSR